MAETMTAKERREAILRELERAESPVSASALAKQFHVSRQAVVGDVAMLRALNAPIAATPRGYVLENTAVPAHAERRVVCRHDDDRLHEELYTVVDLGGALIDVTVEHAVYGQICAPLHIFSRYEDDVFCEKVRHPDGRLLCGLTGGIHLHTLRAPDQATLDRVVQGLQDKGFLLTDEK